MSETTAPVPFTKDKAPMILAITAGILALANVLQTFIRLRSHAFKVPVQYVVSDGSVLQTSNWYILYSLALFSILGTVTILFLAYRLHKRNAMFATGVLAVQVVVAIISLVVSAALLGLVSRV